MVAAIQLLELVMRVLIVATMLTRGVEGLVMWQVAISDSSSTRSNTRSASRRVKGIRRRGGVLCSG
jgi:hypothetical protein